ncbi:response regulator transcription factor [Candidatus Spongiihabitans sp.]|uniref:response regulator transcription factor n=1 Tax=Candidatus Spongiihabitans sp. TaxID=3101308 RepID=UPI003C7D4F33
MASILIIDDDDRLAAPLKAYFERYNLALTSATHPKDGLALLKEKNFELVILDIMLPDQDGFDVCKTIRKHSDIPIVMLTARGEAMDRVVGLELGADDYLAKPFEPRELVARIHNILRRREPSRKTGAVIEFKNLLIDPSRQEVIVNGNKVGITGNEYQLLVLLATAPGEKFSRDEILNKLRGIDAELFSRAVDIQISRLRQKLKPTDYIKTVWGSGYQFVAPEV